MPQPDRFYRIQQHKTHKSVGVLERVPFPMIVVGSFLQLFQTFIHI